MTGADMPPWAEITIAVLLLISAVVALASAVGLVRLSDFFSRMHVPALTATLGVWCVTNAAVLYFSLQDGGLHIYYWLVAVFMTVTVPVTTVLLTRAALFRMRAHGAPGIPAPLGLRAKSAEDER
ncbi:MAG: monovalent cation/H(+) antiporter subunit G [Ottowia sp.]|uniref:monovalent cation/H(+) antiporter subunit G n=1 Tax=Ottowia sp. TaxID=1898956 RepID=UPI0039E6152E